jgi:hypothetical protein
MTVVVARGDRIACDSLFSGRYKIYGRKIRIISPDMIIGWSGYETQTDTLMEWFLSPERKGRPDYGPGDVSASLLVLERGKGVYIVHSCGGIEVAGPEGAAIGAGAAAAMACLEMNKSEDGAVTAAAIAVAKTHSDCGGRVYAAQLGGDAVLLAETTQKEQ